MVEEVQSNVCIIQAGCHHLTWPTHWHRLRISATHVHSIMNVLVGGEDSVDLSGTTKYNPLRAQNMFMNCCLFNLKGSMSKPTIHTSTAA